MNRKTIIGIAVAASTVVIAGCAFLYFREEKDEVKHSAAPKPKAEPSPHFHYVAEMWFKLEDEEKSMTDAVPELHAQLDKFIRGLVDISEEQREELHTYNAFKLGLNSPL